MRKVFCFFLAISLFAITSCHKTDYYGGSWTFQGSTYSALGCSGGIGGILNASNTNNNNLLTYGSIECNFYNVLPATGGRFYVVAYPPKAADQLSIAITIDGSNAITYASTGGNNVDTVNVSVNAKTGYVTVQCNGVEMINKSGGTDSSALSLDLIQNQ